MAVSENPFDNLCTNRDLGHQLISWGLTAPLPDVCYWRVNYITWQEELRDLHVWPSLGFLTFPCCSWERRRGNGRRGRLRKPHQAALIPAHKTEWQEICLDRNEQMFLRPNGLRLICWLSSCLVLASTPSDKNTWANTFCDVSKETQTNANLKWPALGDFSAGDNSLEYSWWRDWRARWTTANHTISFKKKKKKLFFKN